MVQNVTYRNSRINRNNRRINRRTNQNGCYFPLWLAIIVVAFFVSIGFFSKTCKDYKEYLGNETIVFPQHRGWNRTFINFTHPHTRSIVSQSHYNYPNMYEFDWFITRSSREMLSFLRCWKTSSQNENT